MKSQHADRSTYSQNVKTSRRTLSVKVLAVILVFVVLAGILVFHFFDLQINQHEVLAAKAASQQYMTESSAGDPRPNYYPLVLSYVYRIGMTPQDVKSNPATDVDIVNQIASQLELDDEAGY